MLDLNYAKSTGAQNSNFLLTRVQQSAQRTKDFHVNWKQRRMGARPSRAHRIGPCDPTFLEPEGIFEKRYQQQSANLVHLPQKSATLIPKYLRLKLKINYPL